VGGTYDVEVVGRRQLVVAYAFDTNDMRFFDSYAFVRGSDFAGYVIDAFDRLWEEGASQPRMLSIGLHTRIIGRAARIGGLAQALQHMLEKGGAWFARREDIARHWLHAAPPR